MAKRFPNGFNDLLNSVYTYAEDNPDVMPGAAHPGAELIKQTFSYAIGQEIDYYVLVNMDGFRRVINAIGGITIDVERRIPIGGKTDANGRTLERPSSYLEPGTRKLGGYDLLWYGRSRYGADDYDRMERQRCILGAIAKQADPFELLKHFKRFSDVAKQIVLTDIPVDALPELLTLGGKGKAAKVTAVTFVRSASFSPSSPDFAHMRSTVADAIEEASAGASSGTPKVGVPLTRVCGS
jgi:polyisoprenyl-teichoic acid--peptidoglycan teichoic acid transferase